MTGKQQQFFFGWLTAIRRIAVRQTGISRQHRSQIEAPSESFYYRNVGFQRDNESEFLLLGLCFLSGMTAISGR